MRASSILSNSLLGACLVGQGLGVVLFDITQNIGATVMTYGEVRIYDGSVGDCGNENHPTTYCGTTGKLGGGQCTVNGSTGRINDYSAMGCSNAYDIHSGGLTEARFKQRESIQTYL